MDGYLTTPYSELERMSSEKGGTDMFAFIGNLAKRGIGGHDELILTSSKVYRVYSVEVGT